MGNEQTQIVSTLNDEITATTKITCKNCGYDSESTKSETNPLLLILEIRVRLL